MKTINAGIKLSGVTTDQANKVASGWATGGNGWRFAFSVSPGVIDLDTRELTEYSAKAATANHVELYQFKDYEVRGPKMSRHRPSPELHRVRSDAGKAGAASCWCVDISPRDGVGDSWQTYHQTREEALEAARKELHYMTADERARCVVTVGRVTWDDSLDDWGLDMMECTEVR